jgi:peptidoglycan/xylan/chitin deacetylase (PgdA/CDA1 family)
MRKTAEQGHEVGIHCYDHIRWQDGLATMDRAEVFTEFGKARTEFQRVFGFPARTAGAAGWQANALSLAAYDDADLLYGSDARGTRPFFPTVNGTCFKTLQIPSTLPTLDELLGRPEYPAERLTAFYLQQLKTDLPNIFTVHAEIEGMKHLAWFTEFLRAAKAQQINIVTLATIAQQCLANHAAIPVNELIQGTVDGRSGTMAVQAV